MVAKGKLKLRVRAPIEQTRKAGALSRTRQQAKSAAQESRKSAQRLQHTVDSAEALHRSTSISSGSDTIHLAQVKRPNSSAQETSHAANGKAESFHHIGFHEGRNERFKHESVSAGTAHPTFAR